MVENQLEFNFSAPSAELPQLWSADDIYRSFSEQTLSIFEEEDRRLEWKSARAEPKDVAEYLSMFSNTLPDGGVVVIGVEDDRTISGCKHLSQGYLNKINEMRVFCPDAKWISKNVKVKNSRGEADFVIVIRCYYRDNRLVEMTNGNAFIREGRRKRKLTEEEKNEIRINKGQVDFELEPSNLEWPSAFDAKLLEMYRAAYTSKRGLDSPGLEDVLEWSGLGRARSGRFAPNIACTLLFSNIPSLVIPGAKVRIIRYEGREEKFGREQNIVNEAIIEGPIPQQIASAERFVQSQMRNFTRLGSDGRFYTRPEYPKDAWLEAIVNACVHRSYNFRHMNIFIKMFDDRFVVESPGGFLPPTTASNVYNFHNPRNPKLMQALFYLDFVKCAYEGTRRMRQEMLYNELPEPDFSQKELDLTQVHVVLRNKVESIRSFAQEEIATSIGVSLFESLSEEEKLIVNYMHEKHELNVTEAARLIGADWPRAKAILEKLRTERRIFDLRSKSGKERESTKRYVLRARKGNGQ